LKKKFKKIGKYFQKFLLENIFRAQKFWKKCITTK
jgi:hypothetical protein